MADILRYIKMKATEVTSQERKKESICTKMIFMMTPQAAA
jgi:hypothetical protein